jgi:hypothetical protein
VQAGSRLVIAIDGKTVKGNMPTQAVACYLSDHIASSLAFLPSQSRPLFGYLADIFQAN